MSDRIPQQEGVQSGLAHSEPLLLPGLRSDRRENVLRLAEEALAPLHVFKNSTIEISIIQPSPAQIGPTQLGNSQNRVPEISQLKISLGQISGSKVEIGRAS